MGKTRLDAVSDGVIAIIISTAHTFLSLRILAVHGHDSVSTQAMGKILKRKPVAGDLSRSRAHRRAGLSGGRLFADGVVALVWRVPDRRIERALGAQSAPPRH